MNRRLVLTMLLLWCCLALPGCNVSNQAQVTEQKSMIEDQTNEPAANEAASTPADSDEPLAEETPSRSTSRSELAVASFGAGCFWCVEAVFLELDGVESVESGYMGGQTENPTYYQVCSGQTGHAEICQLKYDPAKISYDELLAVFWQAHDPTTLNRQGNDTGTQYRSVVFYHTDEQRELAEKYKLQLDASGAWPNPIVTEIAEASTYYKAEDYHQNYFGLNPNDRYCQVMIPPKLAKIRKVFKDKLKKK